MLGRMLVWNDSWLLGIESLDEDHRKMVRLLNQLFYPEKCPGEYGLSLGENCDAADTLLERFDALIDHVRNHFMHEEDFMVEIDYPKYDHHRHEHQMELAEFTRLRRILLQTNAKNLSPQAISDIRSWFLGHVIAEDKEYAKYYFQHFD